MPQRRTSVQAARKTVWTPSPRRREIRVSRRLVGLGVSLLVSSVILALIAFVLPSSTPSAAASASSRPPVAASTAHKATASMSTSSAPQPTKPPTKPPTPAPTHSQQDTTTPRQVQIHWGDTLWSLARHYHTTVAVLQSLNGLGTSTLIYAGRELRLPTTADIHAGSTATPAGKAPAAVGKTVVKGDAAAAVAFAKAQLGKPYAWGGSGPSAFDCSGLVMRAWQAGGVTLPRTTYEQVHAGRQITRAELEPGDLVFSNGDGHVQLYIGGGQVIEAPHAGGRVRIAPLPAASVVDAYVRVAQPTAASGASTPRASASKSAAATPTPARTTPSTPSARPTVSTPSARSTAASAGASPSSPRASASTAKPSPTAPKPTARPHCVSPSVTPTRRGEMPLTKQSTRAPATSTTPPARSCRTGPASAPPQAAPVSTPSPPPPHTAPDARTGL